MTYWKQIAWVGLVALGGGVTPVAHAEEITERERELMIVIESLKERVTALEEKSSAAAPSVEDSALTERVEALETAVVEEKATEANDFRVYWKDGLNLDTTDERTKLKIGVQVHNDYYWFDQDRSLQRQVDLEDGVEFRRGRLYISGKIHENINFKTEYDFAEGESAFKDVYLELTGIPAIQNVRVGHFKEPFSLEELTSDNDIPMMERSLPNIFAPSRNSGVMVHGAFLGEAKKERLTAAAGVFHTTDDFGNNANDGGYSASLRVTGLPWYANEGKRLLHLGAGYTHRNPDDVTRIRQRPEAHGADRFVDTGEFDVEGIDSYALEAAVLYGPLTIQGEYFFNDVDTRYLGERDFDGYYIQAMYMLTGESRPYKNANGVFDRLKPKHNFKIGGDDAGWGAWEVALRLSSIDLNDGHTTYLDQLLSRENEIRGGEEDNVTLGLNWYLNPNVRVMWNYTLADLDSPLYDGDLKIFQTRFQLAF
jgi:phosphate-selective porin OprO/OprP